MPPAPHGALQSTWLWRGGCASLGLHLSTSSLAEVGRVLEKTFGVTVPRPRGSGGVQERKEGSGVQKLARFRGGSHPAPSPQVGKKMIRCSELASPSPGAWRKGQWANTCMAENNVSHWWGLSFQQRRGLGGRASQFSSHSKVC